MVLESMFINKNLRCNNYKTFLKLSLFIPKIYHKSLIYLPLIKKSTAILNNPIIMDIAVDKNLVICLWLNLGLLLSFMINIFQNLKCLTCSIGRYLNFQKCWWKKWKNDPIGLPSIRTKKINEKIANIIDFQCGIYYAFCYIINTFTNLIILFYFWSTPNKIHLALLFITLSNVHLIICVSIRLISFLPYRPLFRGFSLPDKSCVHLFRLSSGEAAFHAISKCPSIERL